MFSISNHQNMRAANRGQGLQKSRLGFFRRTPVHWRGILKEFHSRPEQLSLLGLRLWRRRSAGNPARPGTAEDVPS